eukprot:CAMPEP_0182443866 /NCGR_PEP_ID=MMETSP1172-20130603/2479_1 /TAXON_ID=708627 /ORGANISM="Timspurckia oligopyrenoides, Strain CCMP3278" /LENGTH=409 /DNA_ID=CAMNT_0024639267 /DNA_START=135 /DNA_END=1364 /DNA_ORIENTATION=-
MEVMAFVGFCGGVGGVETGFRKSQWNGNTSVINGPIQRTRACGYGLNMSVAPSETKKGSDLRFRKLGDSDLLVPEICLGTMTFARQNTLEEGFQQMDTAFEFGVNFIDTAEMYPVPIQDGSKWGETEKVVGKWMKTKNRDDIILATKVAGAGRSMSYVRGGPRVDRKNIREAVHGSLKRLEIETIDLLQIHWPDRYVPMFGSRQYDITQEREAVPIETQLEAMQELIDEGKVRYIGLSNETAFGVCEFCRIAELNNLPKVVSIQNSYSLLHREFESALAEACAPSNYNVPLLAYSPLAGGALTGKYNQGKVPENARFNLFPNYMTRFQESLSMEAVREYVKLAQKYDMSPSTLALAFARAQWFNISSIIGATNLEQLQENLKAFSVTLSDEIIDEINAIHKRYRDPPLM